MLCGRFLAVLAVVTSRVWVARTPNAYTRGNRYDRLAMNTLSGTYAMITRHDREEEGLELIGIKKF